MKVTHHDPVGEIRRLEAEVEALKQSLKRVRRSRAVLIEVLALRLEADRRAAMRRAVRRKRFDGLPPDAKA